MAWANGTLTVYHGTDSQSWGASGLAVGQTLGVGATLTQCRPATDFGLGFYTTTSLRQAREWANARVRRLPVTVGQPAGLILRFDLDRVWLAGLKSLVFVREVQPDYWDFVAHCRANLVLHGGQPNMLYEVVYGLVTIWPSRLLIQDCDQVSFHAPPVVGALPLPTVSDIATAANGLFP